MTRVFATIPPALEMARPKIMDGLIRFGHNRDGGYVIPKQVIQASDALLSMGISTEWSFEEEFLRSSPQSVIHGYDHTISKLIFKQQLISYTRNFFVFRKGVRSIRNRWKTIRDYDRFFRNQVTHYQEMVVRDTKCADEDHVQTATVEKMLSRLSGRKVFVKIDIEGDEYKILDLLVNHADQITGLAIEFHETDSRRSDFIQALKILDTRFTVVHLHGNNATGVAEDGFPIAVEMTFANKTFEYVDSLRAELPIPDLDYPNDPLKADFSFGAAESGSE